MKRSISIFIDTRAQIRIIEGTLSKALGGEWFHKARRQLRSGLYSYSYKVPRHHENLVKTLEQIKHEFRQVHSYKYQISMLRGSIISFQLWIDVSDKSK